MNTLSSRAGAGLLVACLVLTALAIATPTSAQVLDANLDIVFQDFSNQAMPNGEPAVAPVTVKYECGGLTGEVTITAAVNGTTGASASIAPATLTLVEPPDCTPGEVQESEHNLTVTADPTLAAEMEIPVDVTVSGANVLTRPQGRTKATTAIAGPYVAVTFDAKTTEFEVPAGETATVVVDIQSDSNTLVMAMPTLDKPDGWPQPDLFPTNVESPLAGGNGSSALEFQVQVPAGTAPGTYMLNLTVYAHSMGDVYEQTENQTIPLTFTVTPGAGGGGGDSGESPGMGPFPLALLAFAFLGLLRRRL